MANPITMFQLNLKISATISLREKTLQLQFYTTKSAVDVKMTGNNEQRAEQFQEFGFRNGAFYFVEEIMPKFIDFLYRNCDVKASKEFWGKWLTKVMFRK